ncbi:MAG: SDR family NAD(P)-dependent oxidoreductase, partial [Bradymonadaceae bacterium]
LVFHDGNEPGTTVCEALEAVDGDYLSVRPGTEHRRVDETTFEFDPSDDSFSDELHNILYADLHEPIQAVVYTWNFDPERPNENIDSEQMFDRVSTSSAAFVGVVQGLLHPDVSSEPNIWVVTSNAQQPTSGDRNLVQAPLWAMVRSLRSEHPELEPRAIDLGDATGAGTLSWLRNILRDCPPEPEMIYRAGKPLVHRLEATDITERPRPDFGTEDVSDASPFRFVRDDGGGADTLKIDRFEIENVEPREVVVEVSEAGTTTEASRHNRLIATDAIGTVRDTGDGVSEFRRGDSVMAILPCRRGQLAEAAASDIVTHCDYVLPLPEPLRAKLDDVPFLGLVRAYLLLSRRSDLTEGERVLIWPIQGIAERAMISMANFIGAEVFVGANPDAHPALLSDSNVDYALRAEELVQPLFDLTAGDGVEVVVSPKPYSRDERTIEVLSEARSLVHYPGGRPSCLSEPLRTTSPPGLEGDWDVETIDFFDTSSWTIEELRGTAKRVLELVETGKIESSVDREELSAEDFASNFRQFFPEFGDRSRTRLSLEADEVVRSDRLHSSRVVRSNATYLITGGTGGLGLNLAEWLAQEGAGVLVLLSRSGLRSQDEPRVDRIEHRGCVVHVWNADVTDHERLVDVITRIRRELPPLRGVFHLAGLYRNAAIEELSRSRLESVLCPKLQGAWSLHQLTRDDELDHFVTYSSIVSLMGIHGVTPYAAANEFLDSLAAYRADDGRAGLSIGWGPWDSGMAIGRLPYRNFSN